jgi:hypothetical protein
MADFSASFFKRYLMGPNFRSEGNMQSSTCGAFRNSTWLIWRDSYGGKITTGADLTILQHEQIYE